MTKEEVDAEYVVMERLSAFSCEDMILQLASGAIERFLRHELAEGLWVDGKQPLDPHPMSGSNRYSLGPPRGT